MELPDDSSGKEFAYNSGDAGDVGSIPGLGRSSGGGNGNPFQYSCLENPMDGGAWGATVHRVTKSWTQLSDFTFTMENSIEVSQKIIKNRFMTLKFHL